MDKLKPCPFCGGEAIEDRDTAGFYNYRCTKCKCSLYGDYEHHATGRAAWNCRATTPPAVTAPDMSARDAALEEAAQIADEYDRQSNTTSMAEDIAISIRALRSQPVSTAAACRWIGGKCDCTRAQAQRCEIIESRMPVSPVGAVKECCRAQEFSSRVCEKGTKSCIINHTPPAVTAPDLSEVRNQLAFIAAYSFEEDLAKRSHDRLLEWAGSVVARARRALRSQPVSTAAACRWIGGKCDCTRAQAQRCEIIESRMPVSPVGAVPHPDNRAIDRFAVEMKHKMAVSRDKGRSGWDDDKQCTMDQLAQMLVAHVAKGDPVDIANFCMMLHQRERMAVEEHPCYGNDAVRAIRAAATPTAVTAPDMSARDAALEVPEGFALVPISISKEMSAAFWKKRDERPLIDLKECFEAAVLAADCSRQITAWNRSIAQEERACRAEDALLHLIEQISKTSPIDDHGHKLTMSMAYINGLKLINDAGIASRALRSQPKGEAQ